jgi:hypothetical protein
MTIAAAIDQVVNRAVVLECPGPSVRAKAAQEGADAAGGKRTSTGVGERIANKRRANRMPATRRWGTVRSPLSDAPRRSVASGPCGNSATGPYGLRQTAARVGQ